jgi:hypothetical protein
MMVEQASSLFNNAQARCLGHHPIDYTGCQKFCPLFSPLPLRGEGQGEG